MILFFIVYTKYFPPNWRSSSSNFLICASSASDSSSESVPEEENYTGKKKRLLIFEETRRLLLLRLQKYVSSKKKGKKRTRISSLSERTSRNAETYLPINWEEMQDLATRNVDKEHPQLKNLSLKILKKESFRVSYYKYISDFKTANKDHTDNSLDTLLLTNFTSRDPLTSPNLEMRMLVPINSWKNAVVDGAGRPNLMLRLNDVVLAVGSILPRSYEKTTLCWPTMGSVKFNWGAYLKALRNVRNIKSFTHKEKLQAQADFFAILLTRRLVIGDQTIFSPSILSSFTPNWEARFSTIITDDIQFGNNLMDEEVLIEISFSKLDSNYTQFKERAVFLSKMLADDFKVLGINTLYVDPIKALLFHIKVNSFGVVGFTYQALYFSLKEFCKLTGYDLRCSKSDYSRLSIRLNDLKRAFLALKYGRIFFPKNLGRNSIIFVEVNPTAINSDLYKLFSDWPEKESKIEVYKEITGDTLLDEDKIYNKLLETLQNGQKVSRQNLLDKTFPTFGYSKELEAKYQGQIFYTKAKIPIVRNAVYSPVSQISSASLSLTPGSLSKITDLVINLSLGLQPIGQSLDLIPSMDVVLQQVENSWLSTIYHMYIQLPFLDLINKFFSAAEKILNEDVLGRLFYPQYFSKKFEAEAKVVRANPKSHSEQLLNWFNTPFFFRGLFPEGYYFVNNKYTNQQGQQLYDLTINYTRVEEIRKYSSPDDGPIVSGANIAMKREFRKSFQADAAKSMGFYAIDCDAKGLHANLVLAYLRACGMNASDGVNWDYFMSELEQHARTNYQYYNNGLLEKLGINRDSVKKHILALINGRPVNTPYNFIFPEAFRKEFMKQVMKKKTGQTFLQSKFSFFIYRVIRPFFQEHPLVKQILVFREKVNSSSYFMGLSFQQDFNLSKKINYILQAFESLLTISIVIDMVNCKMIPHSIERDGVVFFCSAKQLSTLNFPKFEALNTRLFNGKIELGIKYLTALGDKPPIVKPENQAEMEAINQQGIMTPVTVFSDSGFGSTVTPERQEVSSKSTEDPEDTADLYMDDEVTDEGYIDSDGRYHESLDAYYEYLEELRDAYEYYCFEYLEER